MPDCREVVRMGPEASGVVGLLSPLERSLKSPLALRKNQPQRGFLRECDAGCAAKPVMAEEKCRGFALDEPFLPRRVLLLGTAALGGAIVRAYAPVLQPAPAGDGDGVDPPEGGAANVDLGGNHQMRPFGSSAGGGEAHDP